jgi:hypothetical protein
MKKNVGKLPLLKPAILLLPLALVTYMLCGVWHVVQTT